MPGFLDAHKPRILPIDNLQTQCWAQELTLPQAWVNREATAQARRAGEARLRSNRRRSVDPCTSDLDYSPAELEFMGAMQEYKQSSGRMFPTWSEVLEVLSKLGYEKS
jgi:hypothetical protein